LFYDEKTFINHQKIIIMSKAAEIAHLINKYLFYKLTEQEERTLNEWKQRSENNQALFERLTDKKLLGDKIERFKQLYPDTLWDKTRTRINLETGFDIDQEPELTIISPKTIRWLITGVIIVATIGILSGLYLIWSYS
jgi:hypothetical protein